MEGTALDAIGISTFHSEPIIVQKINMDNNNEEIVTEGLAVDSANHCTQRELDDNSGAGANAGSMTDIMFVTANPLSELIWSPHKGLSLKCADSSLSEKTPSFLRGMGSKNMVLAPPQVITSGQTNNGELGSGGNFISTQMASKFESEVSERVNSVRSPKRISGILPICGSTAHEHNLGLGGTRKDSNAVMELSVQDFDQNTEDHSSMKEKGLHCGNNIQTIETSGAVGNTVSGFLAETSMPGPEDGAPIDFSSKMAQPKLDLQWLEQVSTDPNEGMSSNPSRNSVGVGRSTTQTPDTVVLLSSEISLNKQGKAPTGCSPFVSSPDRNPSGEEHELVTENNLCLQDESAEVGRHVLSQPSGEANGVVFTKDQASPNEASPNSTGVCLYQLKSKARDLSDGERNRTTKKDDSHETVESCNTAGSFKAGKRPCSFEPQLVVSNKKLKQQTHKSLGSASFEKLSSSFMNWISNMITGLPKSDPEEKASLALTVRPPHEHVSQGRKSMLYQKNPYPRCRSMGFQATFESLYLPSKRVQDSITWNHDHQGESSKELDLANMICDKSSTPLSYDEKNIKLCEQMPLSNENLDQGTSGSGGPLTLPSVSSPQLAAQTSHKTSNTAENNELCACSNEKGAPGLSNTSFRNDSNSPSRGKETYGLVEQNNSSTSGTNRGNLFFSAWISRFSPQVSGPLLSSPQCKHKGFETNEGSTGCMRLLPQPQNCAIFSKDQNNLEDCEDPSAEYQMDVIEEMQNYSVNVSTPLGLERTKRHNYQKGTTKLNPILPSKRFRSSEDMASVFATRLDALRNTIPSVVANCTVRESTICLFCGKKGHNFIDCSEIVESELEDLLKSISSDDGSEEPSCLCIRCFQLNHWAISCPNAPLRRETHLDNNASLVNFNRLMKMQNNPGNNTVPSGNDRNLKSLDKNASLVNFNSFMKKQKNQGNNTVTSGNDRNLKSLEKDSQCQVAGANNPCEGDISTMENGLLVRMSINKEFSQMMMRNGQVSDLKTVKNYSPGKSFCGSVKGQRAPTELVLKGKQNASSSAVNRLKENQVIIQNSVTRNIPDVPRGTFETIKMLRLSRMDILKWTASSISASLEGFFIRLRLGKWEEGLGVRGYHVACINGTQREKSPGSSGISLSVSIGGFRCSVENRYISNHDFTEDELLAWWFTLSRTGGKLPSEDDLKMKLEEREKIGF